MSILDVGVFVLTLCLAALGGVSIYWARSTPGCWRCASGRILFVLNLLVLGGTGLVAAFTRAQGLPPLGLVAGLLIVGMMWEGPPPAPRRPDGASGPLAADGQLS